MAREQYYFRKPDPNSGDPRAKLPDRITDADRRALHPVLFPTDSSVQLSVGHWLHERNFRCLEQAFDDIEATQARYLTGQSKAASFLHGMDAYVRREKGLTDREITGLVEQWRSRIPNSMLAELALPRMLMSAAWKVRGESWARDVKPENMREFRRLNAMAFERVKQLSSKAREHLLGHYIGLSVLADNGAAIADIQGFALAAQRRFPQELFLPSFAAARLLPKWGGGPGDLEDFLASAMEIVGKQRASLLYAVAYLNAVGVDRFHQHPLARLATIKDGLVQLAGFGGHGNIMGLQEFACSRRDLDAIRRTQSAWATYASQPQLQPPPTEFDARCRQWLTSITGVKVDPRPWVSPFDSPSGAQIAIPKPLPPREAQPYYSLAHGTWERFDTPAGEVFSCKECNVPVQVVIAVWNSPDPGIRSHDQFIALVRNKDDREKLIKRHLDMANGAPSSDSASSLSIENFQFVPVAGLTALRYEARIKMGQAMMLERVIELMHRGRLIRISVNRGGGPPESKVDESVSVLLGRLKLLS